MSHELEETRNVLRDSFQMVAKIFMEYYLMNILWIKNRFMIQFRILKTFLNLCIKNINIVKYKKYIT